MTNAQEDGSTRAVYMAMEVSEKEWRLACTDLRENRQVTVRAWDQGKLVEEVGKAKEHFALPAASAVYSCYEAGRCGFSIHRFLESKGIENRVVDPASIEVSRRRRHRKTDRLDAEKLLRMLVRYLVYGERKCWQVCRVPTEEQEAARRRDREWTRLKKEHTGHLSRIRSLLALHGVTVKNVRELNVGRIRDWSRGVIGAAWQEEMGRELERLRVVEEQLGVLHKQMNKALEAPKTEAEEKAARLSWLNGIGPVGATALAEQFFWRRFETVREVGSAAGLTGCPYNSGDSEVEQGISKAGNRRVRTLIIEIAWMWTRYQPGSALSRWFEARFAHGGKRLRRIGIVALARKLLVALWKYLEWGLIPEGAVLVIPPEQEGTSIASTAPPGMWQSRQHAQPAQG